VKVKIPYKFLEENTWCDSEFGGCSHCYPYAEDAVYEADIDEVEFDRIDLEDIVDEYLDDIIDIILTKHRKELERRMNNGT
jgi:hypothetical protein